MAFLASWRFKQSGKFCSSFRKRAGNDSLPLRGSVHRILQALLRGEDVPKRITLGSKIFTKKTQSPATRRCRSYPSSEPHRRSSHLPRCISPPLERVELVWAKGFQPKRPFRSTALSFSRSTMATPSFESRATKTFAWRPTTVLGTSYCRCASGAARRISSWGSAPKVPALLQKGPQEANPGRGRTVGFDVGFDSTGALAQNGRKNEHSLFVEIFSAMSVALRSLSCQSSRSC